MEKLNRRMLTPSKSIEMSNNFNALTGGNLFLSALSDSEVSSDVFEDAKLNERWN